MVSDAPGQFKGVPKRNGSRLGPSGNADLRIGTVAGIGFVCTTPSSLVPQAPSRPASAANWLCFGEPCERLIHHNPFSTKHLSLPDLRGELALFRTLAPSRNWLCLYVRTTGSGCLGRPLRKLGSFRVFRLSGAWPRPSQTQIGFVWRISAFGAPADPPNWVRFARLARPDPRRQAAGQAVPPQGCPQSRQSKNWVCLYNWPRRRPYAAL